MRSQEQGMKIENTVEKEKNQLGEAQGTVRSVYSPA